MIVFLAAQVLNPPAVPHHEAHQGAHLPPLLSPASAIFVALHVVSRKLTEIASLRSAPRRFVTPGFEQSRVGANNYSTFFYGDLIATNLKFILRVVLL